MVLPDNMGHTTCDAGVCDRAPRPLAAQVHDLSDWTDPATEQMRQETGHDCIVCPSDVRNLMATTHNLLVRLEAARIGAGSWARMWEQAREVKAALNMLEPRSVEHSEVLNAWRRP